MLGITPLPRIHLCPLQLCREHLQPSIYIHTPLSRSSRPYPRTIPLHLVFYPLPSHALTVTSCLTHRGWHEGIEPSRHILIISLASRHYILSPRPISAHHCLMRYPDEGTHEGIEFTVHHPPFLIFRDHFRTAAGILLPQSYFRNRTFALIIRRSCYHHHSPFLLPLPKLCFAVLVTVTESLLVVSLFLSFESWHLTATILTLQM